jgi:hypothetical protein
MASRANEYHSLVLVRLATGGEVAYQRWKRVEVYVIGQYLTLYGWDIDGHMKLESRIVFRVCGIVADRLDKVSNVDIGEIVRVRHAQCQEI